jgi:hypothetical protein
MYVLISSTTYVWNSSHSVKKWTRYGHKCIMVFMESTRYSCPILIKLEFSRQFFENYSISNFMKIRPVGAELFHATDGRTNGRTDVKKLIVAFSNFANAPKKGQVTN